MQISGYQILHLTILVLFTFPTSQCRLLPYTTPSGYVPTKTAESRKRSIPWSEAIPSTRPHLAIRLASTTVSSSIATSKPAVLVVGSTSQQYLSLITFPPVICGFFDVAPKIYNVYPTTGFVSNTSPVTSRLPGGPLVCGTNTNFQTPFVDVLGSGMWSGTSTPSYSCVIQNSYFCCASKGSSCSNVVTRCKALRESEYSARVSNGGYFKNPDPGTVTCIGECVTLYNSRGTGFYCDSNYNKKTTFIYGQNSYAFMGVTARTLYLTSEILNMYAGSTIVFQSDYSSTTTADWKYSTISSTSVAPFVPRESLVGYINEISGEAPSCLNNVSLCPQVQNITHSCWNLTTFPGPKECFCQSLQRTSCPEFCNTGGRESGASSYVQWVLNTCNKATFNTSSWADFQELSHTAHKEIIPWDWYIQAASNQDTECHSASAILGSFALVNILVGISTLILGRRTIVQRLTCGYLGKPGSAGWPVMALISVTLNILANLVNALLVQHTPGFEAVPIGALVLFWCTRPRIAWMATALITVENEKSMYFSLGASSLLAEIVLQLIGSPYLGMTVDFARKKGYYQANKLKGMPHGWDAMIMYAGALIWLVSVGGLLVYQLGLVLGVWVLVKRALAAIWRVLAMRVWAPFVRSAQRFGYACSEAWDSWVRAMKEFGGACRRIWRSIVKVCILWRDPVKPEEEFYLYELDEISPQPNEKRSEETIVEAVEVREGLAIDDILGTMGLNQKKLEAISFTPLFMLLPFIGQWLFWAGFVRLARDLYCPPPLWSITAVWTLFSMLGVFFGASH